MTIVKRIERVMNTRVLGVYPVTCRRYRLFKPTDSNELESMFLREEIHVAYLHKPGRYAMGFWPGVTGYESYYLDNVRKYLTGSFEDFVPQKGIFGLTRWEDQSWHLCAGSTTYNKLTTTNGEMAHLVTIFQELVRTTEDR